MAPHVPSPIYRALLTAVGLFTSAGAYIADWNETHIYNPRWPPHAKFHNGQTMSMGLSLGAATLYYLWRPLEAHAAGDNLTIVTIFASLYWVTQLSATLYPGTKMMDPEFGDEVLQLYLCAAIFTLIGVGYTTESSRIGAKSKKAIE